MFSRHRATTETCMFSLQCFLFFLITGRAVISVHSPQSVFYASAASWEASSHLTCRSLICTGGLRNETTNSVNRSAQCWVVERARTTHGGATVSGIKVQPNNLQHINQSQWLTDEMTVDGLEAMSWWSIISAGDGWRSFRQRGIRVSVSSVKWDNDFSTFAANTVILLVIEYIYITGFATFHFNTKLMNI